MNLPENPRIILAGSVNSSLVTLQKLAEHKCNVVGVLGLHPDSSRNVSGYRDLHPFAEENRIPFKYFSKINDESVYQFASAQQVDLLFVIGLSQLVREPLLSLASIGNVGFHPTRLPEGRGRGAVAWMILGKAKAAASFFLLDEGMDSGPLLGQKNFEVEEHDYASDVIAKIQAAISAVLDEILPRLKAGNLELSPQDHSKATYLGRRRPKDGQIQWEQSASDIYRLIRATSTPLPGAFTYWKGEKLTVFRASPAKAGKYFGIPGRILELSENRILIGCGEGALWLEDYETAGAKTFKVGVDLE